MTNHIVFSDGSFLNCAETEEPSVSNASSSVREQKKIRVMGDINEAKAKFTGEAYRHEWGSMTSVPILDANGAQVMDDNFNPTFEQVEVLESQDLSEYCICGDVVDHRDGTASAYMGKQTELEQASEAYDDLLVAYLGGV